MGKTQCPDGGFLDDVESFDPRTIVHVAS